MYILSVRASDQVSIGNHPHALRVNGTSGFSGYRYAIHRIEHIARKRNIAQENAGTLIIHAVK